MFSGGAQSLENGLISATSLPDLPVGGQAIVASALLAGLILWLFGGRLVRFVYAVLFTLGGLAAGFFGPAAAGLQVNPYISLVVGGVIGLLLGLLLFRISMGITLGAAGTLVGPLAASAAMVAWPGLAPGDAGGGTAMTGEELLLDDVPVEGADRAGEEASALGDQFFDAARDVLPEDIGADEAARSAAERIQAFVASLVEEGQAAWEDLPPQRRNVLAGSALVAGLIGLLLGLLAPMRTATVGSSFLGAGVWMGVGAWMIRDYGLPGRNLLPQSSVVWVAVWLLVAIAGALLQWTAMKPVADKSTSQRTPS